MAAPNTAWGVEIGAFAIKAIRLERDGDRVRVVDFSVIPHKKVLSSPDLDQNEMIRLGLGQFISQKALEGEHLVMSVPGHAAFARFAKLPPVEPKKVPDIVKFEAVQQIPFPIEEVEWDYQTFMNADSPEVEVGIFAMTRERVAQRLALYSELGITPEVLTLSPVAVYNAMNYDHDLEQRKKAVIYLDIGTSATDLIVANEGACWIRTFPLGGTHFTEAIAEAFKLSYSKAEKLKQEASTSKYAKQIMQAMRPVFTDLLQDVQRSIGYYQSVHRDAELTTVVGLGSTFKIPGLRKFLGQQLQMEVVRLDEYRKIRVEGREAASFSENTVNFATAYGLALQGVGLGTIDANLVPVKVLREQVWHSKIKWFAAAAAIAIVGGGMTFYRPMTDQQAVTGAPPSSVTGVINRGRESVKAVEENSSALTTVGHKASNMLRLTEYRRVWPLLVQDVAASLRSTNPQPELVTGDLSDVMRIQPGERRLISLTQLDGDYKTEAAAGGGGEGQPAAGQPRRLIDVRMEVVLTHDNPVTFVSDTVQEWLRQNAERPDRPYKIVASSISLNPSLFRTERTPPAEEQATEGDRGGNRIDRPNRPDDPNRPSRPTNPQRPGGGGTGGPVMPGGGGGGGGGPVMPGGGGGGGGPVMPGGGGGGGGGSGMPIDPGGGGGGGAGMPIGPGGGGGGGAGGGGLNLDSPDPELKEIEALAPVPTPPDILPPNTSYYRMIITFSVELKQPMSELPGNGGTARSNASDEEAGS